jgi:hypothetical protein
MTSQRVATGVAIALAVAFLIWLLLRDGGDDGTETAGARGPEAVSVEQLREAASEVGHSIYWAGPDPDAIYELTITNEGNVFIRYLQSEDEVGDRETERLTVSTYPARNAYGALEAVAEEEGAVSRQNDDGSLAVTNDQRPESAHLAFPGSDYQIEIFDPEPRLAMGLATSGEITPVE